MAKAELQTEPVYRLSLSKSEATFLKAVLQNPVHGKHPADELPGESKMRVDLWEALNEVLK